MTERPKVIKTGDLNNGSAQNGAVYSPDGLSPVLMASAGAKNNYVRIEEPQTEEAGIQIAGLLTDTAFEQAQRVYDPDGCAPSMKARDHKEPMKILDPTDRCIETGRLTGWSYEKAGRVYSPQGCAPTIETPTGGGRMPRIEEEPKCLEIPVKAMVRVRKHPIDEQELVAYLRDARERSGKTLSQISDELDVPQTMVEHWFRFDCPAIPSPEVWEPLKTALGVGGGTPYDEAVTEFEVREGRFDQADRAYHESGVSPTVTANGPFKAVVGDNDPDETVLWYNGADKRGYSEAREGDGLKIYPDPSRENSGGTVKQGISGALNTYNGCGAGTVVRQPESEPELRIRYLTPRECLRLMGQRDEDIDRIFAAVPSKTAQYRLAGNSIVVDVLVEIFKGIYIDGDFAPAKPGQRSLDDWRGCLAGGLMFNQVKQLIYTDPSILMMAISQRNTTMTTMTGGGCP